MARKITKRTSLKRGNIVRYPSGDEFFVGIVINPNEKFLTKSGFVVFNTLGSGDKRFIKETGADWYQRHHVSDLAKMKAEIITSTELMDMYKNALTTIITMKFEFVPYRNDTLENCLKKRAQLLEKIKKYDEKIDKIRGDTLAKI